MKNYDDFVIFLFLFVQTMWTCKNDGAIITSAVRYSIRFLTEISDVLCLCCHFRLTEFQCS